LILLFKNKNKGFINGKKEEMPTEIAFDENKININVSVSYIIIF
jgi:hypothetical protein